jgi:hypothetical protein
MTRLMHLAKQTTCIFIYRNTWMAISHPPLSSNQTHPKSLDLSSSQESISPFPRPFYVWQVFDPVSCDLSRVRASIIIHIRLAYSEAISANVYVEERGGKRMCLSQHPSLGASTFPCALWGPPLPHLTSLPNPAVRVSDQHSLMRAHIRRERGGWEVMVGPMCY